MVKQLLLLLCVPLLTVSCSEEYLLERKEDKIIGRWEFEKVYYKADNALFRDNITAEYRDDIIEFFGDYTAVYDDYSLNTVFPGDWQIILDRDTYDGGSNLEFFVDAVFYGFFQGEDFALFGSIDKLNKSKLQLEARDRRGTYTFKLCRR
jgi:hypothetical protein